MTDREKLYTISELAKEYAITARTIRFYEDKGLLVPRRAGDRRVYNYRDKARLALILRFKNLGFSLQQITEFLSLYDVDETRVTQLKAGFRIICDRLAELDQQISELQYVHGELLELKNEAISKLEQRGVDPKAVF